MNTTGATRPSEFTVLLEDKMDPPGTRVNITEEDVTSSPGKQRSASGRLRFTENYLQEEDR